MATAQRAPQAVPTVTQLAPARPNPFRGTATVAFDLAQAGPVGLRIYAVDGRKVRTLVEGVRPAGAYTLAWDGRDDRGRGLAAGVYYLRLVTGQGRFTRALTLLK